MPIRGAQRGKGRAGEGNRTLITSLEGSSSTIELHPRKRLIVASAFGPESLTETVPEKGTGVGGVAHPSGGCIPASGATETVTHIPRTRPLKPETSTERVAAGRGRFANGASGKSRGGRIRTGGLLLPKHFKPSAVLRRTTCRNGAAERAELSVLTFPRLR